MKSIGPIAAVALTVCFANVLPAAAESKTPSGRTVAAPMSAQDFVAKVAGGTQFELESARIALQKTKNPTVKSFAEKMLNDHTRASEDLKKIVSAQTKIQLPSDSAMPQDLAAKINELRSASGKDFDAKFVEMMAEDHREDVNLFRSYGTDGSDPAIKAFARRTLPTIEEHMRHIEKIQKGGEAG